jgi:hypothetical protein
MKIVLLCCFILLNFLADAFTQAERPIRDNSFLLEEAYNQEFGVVQHINTFRRSEEGDWIYTFREEWPIPGQHHQLSLTIPVESNDERSSGLGDLLLNYRYQLTGGADSTLAIAPRFSLILPTGNEVQERGSGGIGVQTNFPVSVVLQRKLVTHFNVGMTYTNSARNRLQQKAHTTSVNVGQSLVYEPSPKFNLLFETAWQNREVVAGQHDIEHEYTFFLSPGIRWAHNFSNGLQIVPGIAVPIGLGPSNGKTGIFVYLSFEHRFWN